MRSHRAKTPMRCGAICCGPLCCWPSARSVRSPGGLCVALRARLRLRLGEWPTVAVERPAVVDWRAMRSAGQARRALQLRTQAPPALTVKAPKRSNFNAGVFRRRGLQESVELERAEGTHCNRAIAPHRVIARRQGIARRAYLAAARRYLLLPLRHRIDDLVQRFAEREFFLFVEAVEHIPVPLARNRHHLAIKRAAFRGQ